MATQLRLLAFTVAAAVVLAAGASRPASAQCLPETPSGGTSQMPNCTDDSHGRGAPARTFTIFYVPLHVFAGNPFVSAASWMSTRTSGAVTGREVLKPRGAGSSTLRGGRTPKQVAW